MTDLRLVTGELFEAHAAPRLHPERPERLRAVRERLADADLGGEIVRAEPRPADRSELVRVHDGSYLDDLFARVDGRAGWLDADTYFNEATWDVAMAAAGSVIDSAIAVLRGDARSAMALVRPPGHHAEADAAMGFCLVNNVAAAAAAARAAGADRVAIVDWDVHHGNGTQHIFEADPSVLFVSLHQYPFYPGTGAPDEIGRGDGEGASVNLALPAGSGDADYAYAMHEVVAPTLARFAPDLVLVSAGFDAAAADPLAAMEVSSDGFRWLASRIRAVADEICGGRICAVLEGGYDLTALSDAVMALLEVLASPEPMDFANFGRPSALAERAVFATLDAHRNAKNRWVDVPDSGK